MKISKELKYHKLYLDITKRIAEMSHAERKKVGCCIVKNNNIISFGWNGTPSGHDNTCETKFGITKPSVIHAEMNAFSKLLNDGTSSINGSTIYLTMSPCWDCAKMIIQSGIKKVIFLEEYRVDNTIYFLIDSGIEVYRYENDELIMYVSKELQKMLDETPILSEEDIEELAKANQALKDDPEFIMPLYDII